MKILSTNNKKIKVVSFALMMFLICINCIKAETIKVMDCEYTEQYKAWLKLSEKSNQTIDDTFIVTYDYNNINDLENITYNIYEQSDEERSNSLNSKFEVINNIGTEKNIQIKLTDNSTEGDYILLVKYKDTQVTTKFSVSLDENNELFFGKKEISKEEDDKNEQENNTPENDSNLDNDDASKEENDDPNNDGNIYIEIEDNPLNGEANNDKTEEEIEKSPPTGRNNIILILIVIITLGIPIGTNNYIKDNS